MHGNCWREEVVVLGVLQDHFVYYKVGPGLLGQLTLLLYHLLKFGAVRILVVLQLDIVRVFVNDEPNPVLFWHKANGLRV